MMGRFSSEGVPNNSPIGSTEVMTETYLAAHERAAVFASGKAVKKIHSFCEGQNLRRGGVASEMRLWAG